MEFLPKKRKLSGFIYFPNVSAQGSQVYNVSALIIARPACAAWLAPSRCNVQSVVPIANGRFRHLPNENTAFLFTLIKCFTRKSTHKVETVWNEAPKSNT